MNVIIALTVTGMLNLFGGIFNYKKLTPFISVLGIISALILNSLYWNTNTTFFHHMMVEDNYSVAFSAVCLSLGAFLILFYKRFIGENDHHLPEVLSIIVFSIAGAIVMVSYTNLLMLFLGVEILSLAFYILAGLKKKELSSNEAAMKYFLMGAFSTGFLLFGITLIYGASASFDLTAIAAFVKEGGTTTNYLLLCGVLLILVGLLFKVAAAPFHFWTPDVYQGAPTIITAFFATVGKIASFAAFYRLFSLCFAPIATEWSSVIWCVAIITMFIGNITALQQKSLKRMLAYSSIAHAGYMLLALLAPAYIGASAILFYSVSYGIASMSAFICLHIVQSQTNNDEASGFTGLAQKNKSLALITTISMLSLSGIPLTAGFFGKFYLFSSAVSNGYVLLVCLAVINSFISIYYYF
ncbi:MAG: NADH-quinone oxidoreductase subunit N, partial [Bacteroidota bacterium]